MLILEKDRMKEWDFLRMASDWLCVTHISLSFLREES